MNQLSTMGVPDMQRARLFLVLCVVIVVSGCATPPFDPASESDKLLRRDAAWADLASAGKDVEGIVSYWSDDAIVIPQGQPVLQGKAAIRAFVTASLRIPGFRIHWVSEKPTFSPDGRLAYMRGTNSMTVPGANGELVTIAGRGITIWRLEPDGQWRCVVDTWNDPPRK
jgi:ketosteroid isomerase-like protein